MNWLELFLGQIPEAIYFALFMIYTKRLKEKRPLFIILMILEYLLLLYTMPYNIYAHLGYFILSYLTLKVLYKEKAQIIDVFTMGIASIILMLVCVILYFIVWKTINNFIFYAIVSKLVLFIGLFALKDKLYNIQKIYKKLWNRNDKVKKKMKSATFRSLNVVIFNLMFYILNLILLYSLFLGRSV